jgi:hypothetical protein
MASPSMMFESQRASSDPSVLITVGRVFSYPRASSLAYDGEFVVGTAITSR